MTRLLRALLLLLMPLSLAEPPLSDENRFAEAYNTWIRLREADGSLKVSVQQIKQWKVVRNMWRSLDKGVKYD